VTSGEELLGRLQEQADPAMLIVTTAADGETSGCLAGFGSQVSIDPSRFLICISKRNHTYGVAQRASSLVVHVPPAGEQELAALFGHETGDEVDKLAQVAWRPGPGGAPVLTACPTWVAGPVVDRVDLGDHVGFLVEVEEGSVDDDAQPLRFRQVADLEPGHDA
jgi:flavin reductase (DIM6/NTAB) family NADH-FMN oxidoreductase RutF